MIEQNYTIWNEEGLHLRPAAKFVKLASRYKCEVWVTLDDEEINGKSIMGLAMLAAGKDSVITLQTDGEDEEAAQEAIGALVKSGFENEV